MKTIFAGQTEILVGTRIEIVNITDKDWKMLNGMIGIVTHPFAFGCTDKGWIGIYLEKQPIGKSDTQVNVRVSEIKTLKS